MPTIRPRILKGSTPSAPIGDAVVAVPTIRPRILKDARSLAVHDGVDRSCSAHDPTEDTESAIAQRGQHVVRIALQCPRSDRGY